MTTKPAPPAAISVRRLQLTRPGKVQLIEEQLPPPGPAEILARTVLSGISHGTELAWFRGKAAALHKGWDQEQRLYVEHGEARRYPVAPGYETVAEIEDADTPDVDISPGSLVYLDRPHATRHVVSRREAALGLLPS